MKRFKLKLNSSNKNAVIVFSMSIISKLLSLVRDMVIASIAGVTAFTDAYYIVASIYTTLESGLNNSIYNGFFPMYKSIVVERDNKKRKNEFVNTFVTLILLFSTMLIVLTILLRKEIISLFAPGFSADLKILTAKMYAISSPTIIFVFISECISAILRSHDHFFASQCREIAYHIGAILFVILCYKRFGTMALSMSLICGATARLFIQYPTAKKHVKFRFDLSLKNPDVNKTLKAIPPIILTSCITQLKVIVDKAMASSLQAGSISTLHYGSRLESAIGNIIPSAICAGYFPEFVEFYSSGQKEKFKKTVCKCICLNLFFSIPLLLGSIRFGKEIIEIVYMRGKIDHNIGANIAEIFSAYMIGSVFHSVSLVISNVFYCSGEVKKPLYVNIADFLLNVIFNLILIKKYGALGLAYATAASSMITCFLRILLSRKIISLSKKEILSILFDIAKITVAAFISVALSDLILIRTIFSHTVIKMIIILFMSIALYFLFSTILGVSVSKEVKSIFGKKRIGNEEF